MLNICVVGSRTISKNKTFEILDEFFILRKKSNITFYSGGCKKGVDSYINEYYKNFANSSFIEVPADWKKYGRGAGFIRNEKLAKMMSYLSNSLVIAIWDGMSKGTENMIAQCKKYNVPCYIKIV